MSMPRLTALLARPWANPSANSSQSSRVRSRSMRPSCSSQKPARSNTGTPRSLQSSNARHRQGIRIGALSGDDDAPDALSPQRAGRQRLVHHARAGLLRRDHRLEQPAAPASRQLSQPRDVRCRSEHQDPPDEPTFAHDTVEHHPARQMQTSHTNSTLLSNSTAWLRQSDIEAAVHQQHGGKGEQAGDTGVDQQATPLDADFRPVEADGGGREHDRERQHRGEVGGAERGRLRCADTLVPRSEPGTRPAASTSRR